MKRLFKLLWGTVKWSFIVCFIFILSLFFRVQKLPNALVARALDACVPTNLVVCVDSLGFGFVDGLRIRGLRVRERTASDPTTLLASAEAIEVQPFARRVVIDGLTYPRLSQSYYAPENHERNECVEATLPQVPAFSLELNRPDILGICPARVSARVSCVPDCLSVEGIRLDWPDRDETMFLEGFCRVNLREQLVEGEVHGTAKQRHIRPLLVSLDIPIAVTYIDAFTDVPGKIPARCGWKVNLVNNDFDLELDLDPAMGYYNLVPMRHATGQIRLHVYTRGDCLNYSHTFGPIIATGPKGEPLEGTVTVSGLDGTNTVLVTAQSALPVADLLKVGGFTGEYVDRDVIGHSSCELEFLFPRTMGTDLSQLNGRGHIEVRDGQLMRLKGFSGLLELLADKVPGVAWITDSTQGSCDYVIKDGILSSDNIYIEGSLFSLKMYGAYDAVNDQLNFTVRIQFTKKDSLMGHILHPLTWPFTKLLLEFKLTGSPEHPKWEYVSVLEHAVEATKEAVDATKGVMSK